LNRPDESVVLIDGPWTHRTIRANGIALHVTEAGAGPLVLLLHGMPTFWWTWSAQLLDLADAGYRAVAVDLRGYGASDKPPRGYDATTMAADIAQLVTALGERDAVVVGHDVGGLLAWTMAAQHPRVVRRIAVLGAAHPLRLRQAVLYDRKGQRHASAYALGAFQMPRLGERLLTQDSAFLEKLFDTWSGPLWRGTPRRCASTRWRTARWSSSGGWSGRCPAPTAAPTPARCGNRSTRPSSSCTASSTGACCPPPRRAPRGTSRPTTSGGSYPRPGIFRSTRAPSGSPTS
jgi:pimeloyl-ACP methyl ester carboxylesterase